MADFGERLKRLRGLWTGSGFVASTIVLVTGTALGQAVTVLVSPLLTRLYSPQEFGILAVYAALLGLLVPVAALGFEIAIPLPRSDRPAANVLGVSMVTVVGVTAVTALGMMVAGEQVVSMFEARELEQYLWLVPVGLCLAATYQVWNYWAVRKKAYPVISRTKVHQGIGSSVTQLGLGVFGLGPIGLILGQIIGQAAGITTLVRGALKRTPRLFRHVSRRGMRWSAVRYRRFPIIYSWSRLTNALGLRLPTLLLAALHGTGVAGTFLLAERIVGMPLRLVGTAVGQVYYGEAAEMVDDEGTDLQRLFDRLTVRLLLIGGAGAALVALGGPALFSFVLGGDWGDVGTFVRVLAAMYVVQFVAGPVSETLALLERQELKLIWELTRLLAVVSAFAIAWWWSLTPVGTLAAYAGLSTASLVALLLVTRRTIERRTT